MLCTEVQEQNDRLQNFFFSFQPAQLHSEREPTIVNDYIDMYTTT